MDPTSCRGAESEGLSFIQHGQRAAWQDRAGQQSEGPAGALHKEMEADRMCGEKRLRALSRVPFPLLFSLPFSFCFFPCLSLFSCSWGRPQTVTFQPLSARITGFITMLKFSGITFLLHLLGSLECPCSATEQM